MNEVTVSLKTRRRSGHTGQQDGGDHRFEIEVPPHLARSFGLTVLTPSRRRVIQCHGVVRTRGLS